MMLRYFKESAVQRLYDAVPDNLDIYRDASHKVFNEAYREEFYREIPSRQIDPQEFSQLMLPESGNKRDVENSALVHQLFGSITPYLAKEERLWCYYCHAHGRKYSIARWPIPDDDEKAIQEIRKRYFPRGVRGFERDNPLARLWWMGYVASLAEDLDFDEALEAFLFKTDVRAQLLERPGVGIAPNVINAYIRLIDREMKKGDDGAWFFKSYRSRAGAPREAYRSVMVELDKVGGQVLLDTLSKEEMWKIVDGIYLRLKDSFDNKP